MREGFEVGIVGSGRAGLVTGACLAHVGHRATLVDTDARRVAELEAGRVPIYEPGLGEIMGRGFRRGRARKRWLIAIERGPRCRVRVPLSSPEGKHHD